MLHLNKIVLLSLLAVTVQVLAAHRLCVTSTKEMLKCTTFANITCVMGNNARGCLEMIKNNMADITSLDGGNIYRAGKCYNLKPVVAESSEAARLGVGYYAVAVAKKSSHVNIHTLQGRKSCHTGVNKTAGWFIPMSVLFNSKMNQLGQASSFFSESCVPGAVSGSNMCRLCTPNCNRNSDNKYYGYNGAADCLRQTAADVAFVKHTTFLFDQDRDNYELLCLDGTKAPIEDFQNCHLARVPPHAIVGRQALTDEEIDDMFETIDTISDTVLFSDKFGKDLIFSSNTESIHAVFSSYQSFLGRRYMKALPEIQC
ncbi:serotransferrin-like [Argonauta hians]